MMIHATHFWDIDHIDGYGSLRSDPLPYHTDGLLRVHLSLRTPLGQPIYITLEAQSAMIGTTVKVDGATYRIERFDEACGIYMIQVG